MDTVQWRPILRWVRGSLSSETSRDTEDEHDEVTMVRKRNSAAYETSICESDKISQKIFIQEQLMWFEGTTSTGIVPQVVTPPSTTILEMIQYYIISQVHSINTNDFYIEHGIESTKLQIARDSCHTLHYCWTRFSRSVDEWNEWLLSNTHTG